ncbi:MAG: phosphoglycerate mutase (2,3-diphosphoglycerate-independent) [Gammaproteobacteria bacterium]|nr:phosphoglycerate mutase (2,3-diphosphoglycerate-independent) [Gammaproteobacteria bacterium]|tara:strand:- start:5037 stop:6590 length:1554 start_codon:yes stop_codon:yes gene_type:complete
MKKVTLLVVLDGFGYSESDDANAIAAARTPNWDRFWAERPHTLISGSGGDVGLPDGQMGNSEVGHMNLGAGRVVYQDLTRINRAIEQGEFQRNRTLNRAFERARKHDGAVHVMGLLSPGGVHSHEDQIFACLEMAAAAGVERVYLHAFLDGRDTPPRSALASLEKAEDLGRRLDNVRVASIVGRYFAMDRDRRWDRVERAYNLMVRGEAPFHATSATAALEQAYARDESDEFVQPTAIHPEGELPVRIQDGDAVVFMNFRADRARQITRAMVDPGFADFERRSTVTLSDFVMLTRYADDIDASCAFEPAVLTNTLGEYLSRQGRTQLRIAETEKYAHVTFFFSGGREDPYEGERRILIPSPKVDTYDQCPEMSARKVTDELVKAIRSGEFDAIVCNYANGDMVGHTGDFDAAVAAVETLDECLGRLEAAIEECGGQMLVTADHGNVEKMRDHGTGQAHTAHTSEPVPLVYVGPQQVRFEADGALSDVAPTLLSLMHLEVPQEMTGRSLVQIQARRSA